MAQHSVHDVEEYRRMCAEEVRAITGIEFSAQDQQGRPSLDFHFQQGSGWTFERLVQVLFVHQEMIVYRRFDLLIELYNEEPFHLFRQFEAARELHGISWVGDNFDPGEDIKRLREEFPTCLTPALHLPQFNRFLKNLLPIKKGMETTFQRLAIEMAGLVLKRIGKSKAFDIYINDTYPVYFGKAGRAPFLTGLKKIFAAHLGEFQTNVIEYIKSKPRPRYDNRLSTAVSQGNMGRQFDKNPFQLAFAPSGSGKTTAIFHELTHHYGHYMVSSALAKYKDIHARGSSASSRDLSETLIDPKVLQGVSGDTRELHTMFNYIKSLNPTFWVADRFGIAGASINWWHCIIETRHRVFHWFREALALDSTPALWLSFQLDCSEWDPFLQTFRVMSLFPKLCIKTLAEKSPSHFHKNTTTPFEKKVRWACIDEAQEDLRVTIPNSNNSSLLAACMAGISSLRYDKDNFVHFQQVIFAGTSLNVSKAQLILDSRLKSEEAFFGQSGSENTYTVATKFPLVMDRNAAEKVLKLYGLDGAANAVDQSEPLWGRVKWTAMYCEKIIAEIKKGQTKDFDAMSKEEYEKAVRELFALKRDALSFNGLADETYTKILVNLGARLGILQERGDCRELLDNLLEAAISADILGRPHVFYRESDMELVEQGFATVDSVINQLEFKLEENFTVVSKTNKQLIAELKKGHPIEDGTVDLLTQINKGCFSLVDCTLNNLTADMVEVGFTIVDCTMDKLATELEEEGFSIVKKSKNQLRVQPVKAGNMTNNQIDELAKRMKNGFTVKDCMKDKLTTEMVKHGFTIWGGDKRGKLRDLLKEQDITIDKETDNQLTARLEEKFSVVDHKVSKLGAKLTKEGFIMVDKTMDQLTEVSKNGFTILGGHKDTQLRAHLRGRLSGQDFTIEQETDKRLRVKLTEGCTIDVEERDKLAASLRDSGFIIVDKTINQLDKLMERPFTIINCSKNELMAKLAERVVIDAIILFSIGHYHLDEKLMTFVRLVTSRTGIGHFTENYLAVQLRQYLSQPTGYENETHGMRLQNTWAERQRQVLDCLAEADNCDDQKLGPLNNFNLVMGDQTVKKFESWRGWVNSFLDWLHAIQSRHKPCASFLIPHNDFGPDLVFALRKRNGGEDKIVLCSIQLKLGWGSIDAVNKSSISWACGDRKAGTEEETQKLEAAKKEKEENEKRKKRLEEEARNLESMKNKVEAEEEALKKLGCIENGKDLYTEVMKMVNDGLQKMKGELGNVRKKIDEPENSSNEAGDTISSDLLVVKNLLENTFWRDQPRLSLLIAAGADAQSHLKGVRPNTSNCDQRREYYAFIGARNTKTLFGAPFETMLGVLA